MTFVTRQRPPLGSAARALFKFLSALLSDDSDELYCTNCRLVNGVPKSSESDEVASEEPLKSPSHGRGTIGMITVTGNVTAYASHAVPHVELEFIRLGMKQPLELGSILSSAHLQWSTSQAVGAQS